MRILLSAMACLVSLIVSAAPCAGAVTEITKAKPILILNKSNSVVLRGEVSAESVAKLQIELLEMSQRLSPFAVIYLVLDTPGGSVSAGAELIDFIKALPQKVKTVTVFAASMGFQIAQNLDERMILPSGTLMSHRASGRFEGEFPGEMTVRLQFWLKEITRLDQIAAMRMQISIASYQALIRDEYWVKGANAVADKAADRVILARCDSSFKGTERIIIGSFFGIPISGVVSKCPLITGIMDVRAEGGEDKSKERALELATKYVKNKADVVKHFAKFQ